MARGTVFKHAKDAGLQALGIRMWQRLASVRKRCMGRLAHFVIKLFHVKQFRLRRGILFQWRKMTTTKPSETALVFATIASTPAA
jgi:hypothetical protein